MVPTSEQILLSRRIEANLLGSLFLEGAGGNSEVIRGVEKIIKPSDFVDAFLDNRHRRIYEAMLISPAIDYISVATTMHKNGTLQSDKGYSDVSYMVFICSEVIGLDYEYYANQVHQNAQEWQGSIRAIPKFKGGV